MDNNTAQDNNVKFGYTNVPANAPVVAPAVQPVQPASPTVNDISQISQKIDEINQVPTEPQKVNSYVAQPTVLPNLDKTFTDVGMLPDGPSPLPSSNMTLDSLGRSGNNLDDIMPEFKKPKAMDREPKSNNLAKPVEVPIPSNVVNETSGSTDHNHPNYSINGTNNSKYKIEDL